MTTSIAPLIGAPAAGEDQVFPTLTPEQIQRIAAHGHMRRVEEGDVLVKVGAPITHFYVVRSGSLEALQPMENGESTVRLITAGQFTGEVSMLSGRPSLVTLRVREAGEFIEVDREKLLTLVQTDAELSEIFVRSFVLRRVALLSGGFGDVVLVGSSHCSDTLRIARRYSADGERRDDVSDHHRRPVYG